MKIGFLIVVSCIMGGCVNVLGDFRTDDPAVDAGDDSSDAGDAHYRHGWTVHNPSAGETD